MKLWRGWRVKILHPLNKKGKNMSLYQNLRLQHIAGNPPNSDPQRSSESFEAYKARMAGIYLNPDIDVGETDADYLIRLATYAPSIPRFNISVLSADSATNATNATSASFAVTASHSEGL